MKTLDKRVEGTREHHNKHLQAKSLFLQAKAFHHAIEDLEVFIRQARNAYKLTETKMELSIFGGGADVGFKLNPDSECSIENKIMKDVASYFIKLLEAEKTDLEHKFLKLWNYENLKQ